MSIEVQRLTKRFGAFVALNGVSFTYEAPGISSCNRFRTVSRCCFAVPFLTLTNNPPACGLNCVAGM